MPYDWDQVIASTKPAWFPFVAQGVYESDVLFRVMFRRDRSRAAQGLPNVYITERGGHKLVWSATVAKPDVQTVSGFQMINTIQPNQFTSVELPWAHYVTAIAIDKDTEDANVGAGEKQVFDLIEALMENARLALGEKLSTDLYNNLTTPPNLVGLRAAIGDNTDGTSYANVTRTATTTWWNSKVVVNANNAEPALDMINLYRVLLTDADYPPDLIVTDKKTFNKIWSQALPQQQMTDRDDQEIGWEHVSLGRTKITYSKYCPDGHLFYLCLKYIRLVTHQNAEFDLSPEIHSPNQLAWTRHMRWKGQLMVINPVWQGRLYNLNVS